MASFLLLSGPCYVRDSSSSLLTGYYSAEFAQSRDGVRSLRFLTERGRAEMLDCIDRGQRAFSTEELEEMTVTDNIGILEARYEAESGVGG